MQGRVLALSLALLAAGCAYRLGPSSGEPAGSKSIQVGIFENETIEPRLSDAVIFQLRKQLQQDGTYRLETQEPGDIIVTGKLVQYERAGLSFQPRDVITPRDYRITLFAQVTARDRQSGKVLLNRRVSGHTNVRIGADLPSAERQALPVLAEELARNITSLLVDGEWPD